MGGFVGWVAQSGVVQGVIIGATLAFFSAILVLNAVLRDLATIVNGWSVIRRCGRPGNGVLMRAACARALPLVNVFEEAAYWMTTVDGSGRVLRGRHGYVLRFPAGQLPPNDAFWSLTVTDIAGYMVSNPANRCSIDDRSTLARNVDGSIDIHLQQLAPAGQEQNWLPVPSGRFKLMLRVYLPGAAILNGTYVMPPVVRAE